ncbi:SGNH hydrolase-type esterase domain-containing protein [Xylariaceae sp. FL1272]|nr:SGNH hydrolase-type esterase domain-containing protein [Xylariaceae sp. FL1272]
MAVPYKQLVLFGDSLFEFCGSAQDGFSFQGALQQRCMRGLDVINRGLSGYNTRDAVHVFPKIFLPPSPSIPRIEYLIVLFGANDAALPGHPCNQHIPIDEYKLNLKKVITHEYIKQHKPNILLCAPPPLEQTTSFERDCMRYPGHPEPSRTAAQSAEYSEAARQVASEVPGVILIDLQKLIMDRAISMTPDYTPKEPKLGHPGYKSAALQKLLPDGLHMSGLAYQVFFEEVVKHLDLPDPEDPDQMRKFMVHPGWRELK